MIDVDKLESYFMALDELKTVERRSYIAGGLRLENSAEHSWHLAMACWSFAKAYRPHLNMELLLKLALVHDLGEVHAGDTFLYAENRGTEGDDEREGVAKFASHPGNGIDDLLAIWDEQETGRSEETRLVKVLDRILPLTLNLNSQGIAWKENGVKRSQVLAKHRFIADYEADIFSWIEAKVEQAVEQGWLIDDRSVQS